MVIWHWLFCLYFFSVLTSCVSFRGDSQKDLLKERLPRPAQKVSISFTNESVLKLSNGKEIFSKVEPIVEGYMLVQSEYFLTTASIPGREDARLEFKTVTLPGDSDFWQHLPQHVYLGLSLMTLTAIPYYETVPRRLEVKVFSGKKFLKAYKYSDHQVLFSWLLAAPFWRPSDNGDFWYQQSQVLKDVDHNLVRNFLKDFHRDFLMGQ